MRWPLCCWLQNESRDQGYVSRGVSGAAVVQTTGKTARESPGLGVNAADIGDAPFFWYGL